MAEIETERRGGDAAADPKSTVSTIACCGTAEQATCCETSEKSACCGTPDPATQPATRCGCR